MAFSIASGSTATGAELPAGEALIVVLMGVLSLTAACAAIFLTAYLKTVPAFLKSRYARRQGSLRGWDSHREAADAADRRHARTAAGRLLVDLRDGTWSAAR